MRGFKRGAILGVLAAFLAAACASPVRQASGDSPMGGAARSAAPKRITAVVKSNPPTLSSTISGTVVGKVPGVPHIEQLVHAGLAVLDDRGERRPQLAEVVPDTDNGLWRVFPDGRMETTWRIRESVRWHDGTPFTSDDLVFSASVFLDRSIPAFRHRAYDALDRVEPLDDRTVVVRWSRPFIDADLLFSGFLAMPMPKHLLETAFREDKTSLTQLPYWNREFVGAGPFKLRQWVEGSHVVLDAYDHYTLGRPNIDEIEVRFVPDANTIVANVLAGVLDLTMGRGISLEQGLQLRDLWPAGRMDQSYGTAIALYPQHLNPSPSVLANLRFRRALLHAIDRQQMADTLMAGQVPVAHSVLDVRDPFYLLTEAQLVRYEYDPRGAVQISQELGLTRGSDGTLHDTSGQRLAVEIQAVVSTELNEKSMLAVADYWQRLGISVATVPIPLQRQGDREYRATRSGFDLAGGGSGPTALTRWTSSEAPIAETGYLGTNKTRYMNPEFDALVDRYLSAIPRAERAVAVGQIVRHISENAVIMGLVYEAEVTMVSNRLQQVNGNVPTDAVVSWNAHEWDVK